MEFISSICLWGGKYNFSTLVSSRKIKTKNPGAPHPGYLLGGGKYEMKEKEMVISLLLLVYI
jgi:hypothetical protein